MIIYDDGKSYRVVKQPDHGKQCVAFARFWGNEEFDFPTPALSLERAAGEHDNGWTEWEQHPTIDERYARPWQFMELQAEEHVPLYRRGIARSLELDPYTGILVSMHGTGLYNGRYGTFAGLKPKVFTAQQQPIVDGYIAEQTGIQESLRQRLREQGQWDGESSEARLWHNYRLLQILDRLSLWCCFQNLPTGKLGPTPTRLGQDDVDLELTSTRPWTLSMNPYPFREARVEAPVEARDVPKREYRSPEHFLEEFERAQPYVAEFVLVPA